MTYLERITYLVGNFIELSQYVLKNAYRVAALYENSKGLDCYTRGSEMIVQSEENAKRLCKESSLLTGKELEDYFLGKGLSDRDYKAIVRILRKREYVMNYFFIANAYGLSKEDVMVYESKIQELEDLCKDASVLIGRLSKESDKLYALYQK